MVILLYPGNPALSHIAAGSGTVMKLPIVPIDPSAMNANDIKITNVVLSDPNAVAIPVKGATNPNLPTSFTLDQNYPNPFNPETTIDFAINANNAYKTAKLTIYNLLGERVTTLLDKPLPAGNYSFRWKGTNDKGESVASGVYFYRLTVGDQAQSKKMVLLK